MRWLGFTAGAMALAAFGAAPREAQAGTRLGVEIAFGRGYTHGSDDYAYRAGYERGYRDGFGRGASDADQRRDTDFDRDKHYRCADAGYGDDYGPKSVYQTGYRRGYELAYREGYTSHRRDQDEYYHRRWNDRRDGDRPLDRRYDRERDDHDRDDR